MPIDGRGDDLEIDAQGIDDGNDPARHEPDHREPLTLEVEVLPVPGEDAVRQQHATYTVTFE